MKANVMVASHNEDTVKFTLEKYVLSQSCIEVSDGSLFWHETKCRVSLIKLKSLKALIHKGLTPMDQINSCGIRCSFTFPKQL